MARDEISELENMPERWKNKRSEKEEEIADLKADKRALKREISLHPNFLTHSSADFKTESTSFGSSSL